jgi:hypothetical protein
MGSLEERRTTGIGEELGKAGTAVKEGIIRSLRGINEIEAEMISLVRNTVSNTLRATGAVTGEISISSETSSKALSKRQKRLAVD